MPGLDGSNIFKETFPGKVCYLPNLALCGSAWVAHLTLFLPQTISRGWVLSPTQGVVFATKRDVVSSTFCQPVMWPGHRIDTPIATTMSSDALQMACNPF